MCNNAQGYYLHLPRPIIDRTHQPKGSMCMECIHKTDDCRELKFEDMQVIGMNNDIFVVKCNQYRRQ